jgi:hypothetical protein
MGITDLQKKWQQEFMENAYKILTDKKVKFPEGFSYNMKINLCTSVIEYYKDTENFEYCTQLNESLKRIKNETNS